MVADITYIRTWNGFVYLAFMLVCYGQMIVGWQLATRLAPTWCSTRWRWQKGLRRPAPGLMRTPTAAPSTPISATPAASTSSAPHPRSAPAGVAYDNAIAEAWVATFKSELVDGRRFPSYEHVEHETLHWIGFYNEQRLQEELGDLPPDEYEQLSINNDNSQTLAGR